MKCCFALALPFLGNLLIAAPAAADELLIVDANGMVMLLDSTDGSVIAPNFIDTEKTTGGRGRNALSVGNEIWVSIPELHGIARYEWGGLPATADLILNGLDSPTSMTFTRGRVFVACGGNYIEDQYLAELLPDGTHITNRPYPDGLSVVLSLGRGLLTSHYDSNPLSLADSCFEDTSLFSQVFANNLSLFANGVLVTSSNCQLLELQPNGTLVATHDLMAELHGCPLSALKLESGELLWSGFILKSPGLYRYDPKTKFNLRLAGGGGQEINRRGEPLGFRGFCDNDANSTGFPAILTPAGSASIEKADLELWVAGMPQNSVGYIAYSATSFPHTPFGNGILCLSGDIFHLPVRSTECSGSFGYAVNLAELAPAQISTLLYAQAVYRDGTSMDVSDMYYLDIQP